MTEYRRRKGRDTWHWCTNCPLWPPDGTDYDVTHDRPSFDLCNTCKSKEREGNCKEKK